MKQFKRIISFVIAMTMIMSMFSITIASTSAATKTYILGDANQDGKVDVMDATYIQRYSALMSGSDIEDGSIQFAAADVNYDGKVSVMDATIIQRYVALYDVTGYDVGKTFTFGTPDDDETTNTEESSEDTQNSSSETVESSDDTVESSEDTVESSEETIESSEDEEVTEGYYLVGTLNGQSLWSADTLTADRKLKENPDVAGEYMLNWTFYGGDELKVAHFDGTGIDAWYNDGGDNYKIGETSNKVGPGTVYFNPNGNPEWSYKYLTVQPRSDESSEETVESSEETTDSSEETTDSSEGTVESSEEDDEVTAGYYLVGTLNGESLWNNAPLTNDRKFKENPAVKGEYLLDWTFYGGDELKVVYFDGTEIKTWYKDQADNYKIGADSDKVGDCTVYFNPDGNSDWSYTYFTVQPREDKPTTDESSEETVESSEDTVESSEDTVESSEEDDEVTAGYYLVGALNGKDLWFVDETAADRKLEANPKADG
ncbi:MAG: dockerin type I repeat-containing protein, partial [Ruminococcus sp.]|nr:dockerin type I repeat-containing protein [Ruminococcus sp.]